MSAFRVWLTFCCVALLGLGALGVLTHVSLSLEREQLLQQAHAEQAESLRLALWRLDGRMTTVLAREETRPYNHYSAVYTPATALRTDLQPWNGAVLLEPSPLLTSELPPWMPLHFQVDARGWQSPQVLSRRLSPLGKYRNATPERARLLAQMSEHVTPVRMLQCVRQSTGALTLENRVRLVQWNSSNFIDRRLSADYVSRGGGQSPILESQAVQKNVYDNNDRVALNSIANGEEWLNPRLANAAMNEQSSGKSPVSETVVRLTPLRGIWLTLSDRDYLLAVRSVRLEERDLAQGIVLDAEKLLPMLTEEIEDLLPDARIVPLREPTPSQLRRSMTALPLTVELPETVRIADPGWTGLRLGLLFAWASALVALLAVGLGAGSLLTFSNKRMRFVSAVTHELRSPLTTLRLYLDLLINGLIREEQQRENYIRTLHAETDRLSCLVNNVLEFARLENQGTARNQQLMPLGTWLVQVAETWKIRLEVAGKQLVLEVEPGMECWGNEVLLGQILGNLLDNACKYTRDAADARVWMRARREGDRVILEVEDRGPGIARSDERLIFQTFERGRAAEATTGGVGLGLSLARRWAGAMGGTLTVHSPTQGGACFRLILPQRPANAAAPSEPRG